VAQVKLNLLPVNAVVLGGEVKKFVERGLAEEGVTCLAGPDVFREVLQEGKRFLAGTGKVVERRAAVLTKIFPWFSPLVGVYAGDKGIIGLGYRAKAGLVNLTLHIAQVADNLNNRPGIGRRPPAPINPWQIKHL
jgi:hypothetical protein